MSFKQVKLSPSVDIFLRFNGSKQQRRHRHVEVVEVVIGLHLDEVLDGPRKPQRQVPDPLADVGAKVGETFAEVRHEDAAKNVGTT